MKGMAKRPTALLQVSTDEAAIIYALHRLPSMPYFARRLLADPGVIKVGAAIMADLVQVRRR